MLLRHRKIVGERDARSGSLGGTGEAVAVALRGTTLGHLATIKFAGVEGVRSAQDSHEALVPLKDMGLEVKQWNAPSGMA